MCPSPGSDQPHWIMLFDSIHHVLAAEKVFKEHEVACDLVPVPRDLRSDCGMALKFCSSDLAAVRGVLAELSVKPRNVYRPCSGGYEEVTI